MSIFDSLFFEKSQVPATAVLRINVASNISQCIAQQENEHKQKKSIREMVPDHYYAPFHLVFEKDSFDELLPRQPWDHAIDIVPGANLTKLSKVYPLSLYKQKELDDFLDENLKSGRIRGSKSPWRSGFFFVKKKNGKLRPVQDYQKLNSVTVKNVYSLPLISEIISKLRHAWFFSKMDIHWEFNNIRIKEGDEDKAGFLPNRGLFEPMVMFFGLCNSLMTFQTMMNNLLKDLILCSIAMVYMDDILAKTLAEHQKVVLKILEILDWNKLYLKPEKCEFEKTEIEYLGVVIREGKVAIDLQIYSCMA